MPDDAYSDEVKKHALTILEQSARILRTDADIVELIHKMIATAEEEVKRHPALLFERGSVAPGLEASEGDIVGGQKTAFETLIDTLLNHIKDEKQLLKDLIGPHMDKIIAGLLKMAGV
jgi:hypothetical protein